MKITFSNVIAVLLVVYIVFCIGEIEVKNVLPNPQYSNLNIIANFVMGGK